MYQQQILTDDSDAVVRDVNKMLDEQIRVLKTGGYYVIVTLAQDHIVTRLRERFRTGFSANVHWIPTRSPLSTFLFAFRKLENTKATTTYKIYFANDAQTSASNHVIRSLLSSNKHVLTVDNPHHTSQTYNGALIPTESWVSTVRVYVSIRLLLPCLVMMRRRKGVRYPSTSSV